jgi:ABC-type polysaccharide/polyol phosphate export permease
MIDSIRELIRYRELLYMITWRDIHIKYKQSIMGFMWAILMPIIVVSAGVLVKFGISIMTGRPMVFADVAAIMVKSVPWAFFVASIRFATNSLVGNANLVTKIYFPKALFPLASVFSQLFDFAIASCMLSLVLIIARIGLSFYILWTPVLIFLLVLMVTGAGILLSAANLFFRDVKYLVEVVLTFSIFVTPVFYDVSMFGKWANLLMLNPVAPILEGLSAVIVYHREPQLMWLGYSALVSLCVASFAVAFFKRLQSLFAERI